jgi:hypothetical protein
VSASRHLHDLLAQLNKEVVVERLADAQGVTLEAEGESCPISRARIGNPVVERSVSRSVWRYVYLPTALR